MKSFVVALHPFSPSKSEMLQHFLQKHFSVSLHFCFNTSRGQTVHSLCFIKVTAWLPKPKFTSHLKWFISNSLEKRRKSKRCWLIYQCVSKRDKNLETFLTNVWQLCGVSPPPPPPSFTCISYIYTTSSRPSKPQLTHLIIYMASVRIQVQVIQAVMGHSGNMGYTGGVFIS